MPEIIVETCAGCVDDVLIADTAGAHRVELNSAIPLGGLTPSLAVLSIAKSKSKLPIVAMARPRAGNFCYDSQEFETLQLQIKLLIDHGANGIAIGITDADGNPDLRRLEQVVKQVEKIPEFQRVYHRAIDIAPNWRQALQQLVDLGFQRVLTSGQKQTATEGLDCIADMYKEFGDRIEILPGSGISPENAVKIIEKTGCQQIHGSFSKTQHSYQTSVGHFGDVGKTDLPTLQRVVNNVRKTPPSTVDKP